MTDQADNTSWPLPAFYFSVEGIPGNPVFQEVSGLDSESQVIEYRAGDSRAFAPIKMPGLAKVGNVTLKKGVFADDAHLWSWLGAIPMNTVARTTVTITLSDQAGQPTMVWTLHNAFPIKLTGTDLKSDGNEVAVERLELAYETLTVSSV